MRARQDLAPAVRRESRRAVPRGPALHRAPASVEAPRAVDVPAGFLAEAPTVVQA